VRDKYMARSVRVGAYVDGFNLYHGLRELSRRRDLWLDLHLLAENLLREDQELVTVQYFTAPVRNDAPALIRQKTYNLALEARGVGVVHGHFQEQRCQCRWCGATWRTYEEKRTDVAIAATMVRDVALDYVDRVLLISADADLCAAIEVIRSIDEARGSKTKIVTVFPPGRRSDLLRKVSDAYLPLASSVIRRSQLPPVVIGGDGASYHRPPHWN
jgi:uncharacterized LabA/DUF88 family protein